MIISREAAIALFRELGLRKADVWDNARLAEKLSKLDDMVEEDTVLVQCQKDLVDVLACIKKKGTIEVKDAEAKVEPVATSLTSAVAFAVEPAPVKTEFVEPAVVDPLLGLTVRKGELPVGPKSEDYVKAVEDKLQRKDGRVHPKGIRVAKTTPWYCGFVLAEFKMEDGITEEMVERVDQLRGKNNPGEARAALAYAWHAINGYAKSVKI